MNNAWSFAKRKAKPYKHGNSSYTYGWSLLTERGSRELSNLIDKYAQSIRQKVKSENNLKRNFEAEYTNIKARDRAEYNNFVKALSEVRARAAATRQAAEKARLANNNLKQMVAQLTKSIKKNQQKLRPSSNALAGLGQLRANLKRRLFTEYKRANAAGNVRTVARVSRSLTGIRSPPRQRL
jgi:chromosome segregation ATPase